MLPFEFHSDDSETENDGSNQRLKSLIKPMLSVVCVNGDYYAYQGESLKHGIGLSKKCKTDRYFITDVIEKLASKAFLVVADSKVEELSNQKRNGDEEEDEDSRHPSSGVIIRSGDVVRFGRVCYLIKETSIDVEKRAVCEISKR